MKKIFITCLLLISTIIPVFGDDVKNDFLDIAANYCIQGDYNEAIDYLNKAIAHDPQDKDLQDIKSGIQRLQNPNSKSYLTLSNQTIKAAENFRKYGNKQKELETLINGAETQNPWTLYYLAEYYRNEKKYNTALDYYDKALEIKNGFVQCYLGITLTLMEMHNYEAAKNALAYYLDKCPKSDLGYALRAEINMYLKNYVESEADIITALSISDDIEYKILEGKILYNRGNYKSAKEKLENLTKSVKTAEIYKYIGLCDYALNDYNNALLNLNNAIILSDDDKETQTRYNEVKNKLTNGS